MNKFLLGGVVFIVLFIVYKAYINYNRTEKFSEEKKIIFVYADWCGHCTRFKPEWSKVEQECKSRNITTTALNVDDEQNGEFINKYEINSFPTLIVFKGNQFKKYEGDRTTDQIVNFVENF